MIAVPAGLRNADRFEATLLQHAPHIQIHRANIDLRQVKIIAQVLGAVVVYLAPNPYVVVGIAPFIVWPLLRDSWRLRSDPRVEQASTVRWLSGILLALAVMAKALLFAFLLLRKHLFAA